MPDERSRMMVSQVMSEKLGPEFTAALMECVPPFAWTEIATKADLERLERTLRADIDGLERGLRGDIDRLTHATASDIDRLTHVTASDIDRLTHVTASEFESLGERIGALRFELLGVIEAQGSRTLRWTVGSMFAAVATLSAAMTGIAALAR